MTVQNELMQLIEGWVASFGRGDIESCVRLYSEDGAIYSPYGPAAIGRQAIRRTHEDWLAAGETNKKIDLVEARAEGNLAYCVAAYSGDFPQEDGSLMTESGTSLNIAMKQADGSWRFHISSLNSDTPPLAEPSADERL